MLGPRLQFAAARRVGAIPLALVLLIGGVGGPVLTVSRFSELEEHSPAKNLCEELLLSHRVSPLRHTRFEVGSKMLALTILKPQTLGNNQKPVLISLRGHRLPNGLLAPITC
jgi:hypothetical protein